MTCATSLGQYRWGASRYSAKARVYEGLPCKHWPQDTEVKVQHALHDGIGATLYDHKPYLTSTSIHVEPCMNCAVTQAKQHNGQQIHCCATLQLACIVPRRYSVTGSNCSAVVCMRISCSLLLTTAKMSLCKRRSQIYRNNPEPSRDLRSASNSCITSSVCMCHPETQEEEEESFDLWRTMLYTCAGVLSILLWWCV